MLPKENRLKKKKDFEKVAGKGRAAAGGFLVLKFVENGLDISRVGFVVSKKISNKAVIRNKVKRRLRSAIRALLPQLRQGYDLVFFSRPSIESKDFQEIKEAVDELLKRARLLHQ